MLYNNAYEGFNAGDVISAVLVDTNAYTPVSWQVYLDSVPNEARIGVPHQLIMTKKDGVYYAEDSVFTGITKRQAVGGVVLFKDRGTDDASPLIAFVPIEGDSINVFMVAYVRLPSTGLFSMVMHGAIGDFETAQQPLADVVWIGDDGDASTQICTSKLEVLNIYSKMEHFPFRTEVEPWVPPYRHGTTDEKISYPYNDTESCPADGFLWRQGDWSPQNGRFPVPSLMSDMMHPVSIPPHFNPQVEGAWGTAFQSIPWAQRTPLTPFIPEGQDKFFCDPERIKIRQGTSMEMRFYLADAHGHLVHHLGSVGRDVAFCMRDIASSVDDIRLTHEDKVVYLPTSPGEPVVVQLDSDETGTEGRYLFELVLSLGEDKYIASSGAIEITPAFGTADSFGAD